MISLSDFPLGSEIAAALAAADRKACQRVFKDLLKAKEFNNSKVDGRMETQSSFIWPDRAVKLHTEAAVNLHLIVVVYPCYTEHDLAFRFNDSVKNTRFYPFRMLLRHWFKGFQNLCHGLMKFRSFGFLFLQSSKTF